MTRRQLDAGPAARAAPSVRGDGGRARPRARADAARGPRQPGLPEEPRGQRGHAGPPAARAATSWCADAAGRRRHRREHLRLHRPRQAGVDRHHPGDGAREGDGPRAAPGGHRLPGAALRRRSCAGDPGDRRHASAPARSTTSCEAVEGDGHRHRRRRSRPPGSTTTRAPRVLTTPAYMAYVKISEGCDYTCSFCIIPTLRGKHRSRPLEDVVARGARRWPRAACAELVLVAQDSTRYGLDLGHARRPGRCCCAGWAASTASAGSA